MIHSGKFPTGCSVERVFRFLTNPEHFAPLIPGYQDMSMQDRSHFTVGIAISLGQISGNTSLAMELVETLQGTDVKYRGEGIVAGSQLRFGMQFQVAPVETLSEVSWQGELSLDGPLASMAGGLIENLGRQNFELMAERLQNAFCEDSMQPDLPGNSSQQT